MDKKVFVTMRYAPETMNAGWPVAVYATEEAAQQAVADSAAAKAEIDRLFEERVSPHIGLLLSSCAERKEGYTHQAKDGYYYATAEMAASVDVREDFYASEDVKELQKRVTGEDFYEEVKFVE